MEAVVREIVERVVAGRGFELVDVEIHARGKCPLIRVFMDKQGGITVGDCGELTRELTANFMVEESIPEDTLIEVSSPGMDRPFKTLRDYERNRGRKVEVRHVEDGKERVTVGVLEAAGPEGVRIMTQEGDADIKMESIKVVRQHISF